METEAVGIAVAGWLAGHLFAIRAQRKAFVNTIRNDARKQIGQALREYEDWCSTVFARLWGLKVAFLPSMLPWSEERWLQEGRELGELLWAKATWHWALALEENEILFPRLKRPRQQLHDWQREISDGLSAFMSGVWLPQSRRQAVEDVQKIAMRINDQRSYAEYLHVYLQNLALGEIVLRKRRVPAPRDVTLLRLVESSSDLRFDFGEPAGLLAFAWRRVRHPRVRPIFEDAQPQQRALFGRLTVATAAHPFPASDWWIQGGGQHMAVQILDARSGRELWLMNGSPDKILSEFSAWIASRPAGTPSA